VSLSANTDKALTFFSFANPAATGTINEAAKTVTVTVPHGTTVSALAATFAISGASVNVGPTIQTSGTTANNFTSPVTYAVTAADGTKQNYVVTVTISPNAAKALTAFSFSNPAVTGTINEAANTVTVTVPYGTKVTALAATFAISGTSVKVDSTVQTSGTTANNFTSPVTYIVVAEDGTTHNYMVTVTITSPGNNANLSALSVSEGILSPAFNATTLYYTVDVVNSTKSIFVTGTRADQNATIDSKNGVSQDLGVGSNDIMLTVTAQNGTTKKTYTINVNRAPPPVTFSGLSANGDSAFISTTVLTLTFSAPPTELTINNITVTGATKGTLSLTGSSTTRTLTISKLEVPNEGEATGEVTVKITGTSGSLMTSSSKSVSVYRGLEMIKVPAGKFQRDENSSNQSQVTAFQMSACEITRNQFKAIMNEDPSYKDSSSGMFDPVQNVNWYKAIAFCNMLSIKMNLDLVYEVKGVDFHSFKSANIPTSDNSNWNSVTASWDATGYRLPTEMEWMWAAMGATDCQNGFANEFAGTDGSNDVNKYVWHATISSKKTHPVGTKLPNELGLYDISGNVWEWCWDWYGDWPNNTLENYHGPDLNTNYRVGHGGSWKSQAQDCNLSYRYPEFWPTNHDPDIGFRVVRLP
jgi:formylglycine-generating enzyme required for sulfatase activity